MGTFANCGTGAGARFGWLLVGSFVAVLAAAVSAPVDARKPTVRNPEDLLVVDCLLPGQVRKLGSQATFMSARRPVRTTQADCQIRGGEYVAYDRANYQTALKVWMDQATAGSAEAQNYVGEIYLKGLGIEPDYDMAAVWFKKAAAQNFNRAKINLGHLYEQGLGVAQDRTRALNLYREAAGVQGDDLLYASEVQVQLEAKDTEIGSLRMTVEEQRQETDSLRARVADLESQLASRRAALQSSQNELQAAQAKLAEARKATGADFSAVERQREALAQQEAEVQRVTAALASENEAVARRQQQIEQQQAALKQREAALAQSGGSGDDAALQQIREQTAQLEQALAEARTRSSALQTQLADRERALQDERQQYQAQISRLEQEAAGRQQEDWELMKLLEGQLAQREAEIRTAQAEIATLAQQVVLGSGEMLAAAPALEIIEPALTLTRGRPAAMLRGGAGRQSLTGRVANPRAVREITVNGTPVILGDNGLFRASVEVPASGSTVQIAAVDQRGATSSLEFQMVPQPQGAAGGQAATAAMGVPPGVKLGRYHALVIGNNSYQSAGYPSLQSAVNDATAVAQLLRERYGYETNLLLNATRFQMLTALNEAREALGPDDNLLLYYAGHGEIGDDGKQGYWVPTDGQANMVNTWVSNTAISEILETMKARHVLVVADSCYSGAMTRAAVPVANAAVAEGKWAEWVKTMVAGRSRMVLTSGGVQPVPDTGTGKHSFFARAFLNTLDDNNRLLEGQQLFRQVTSSLALAALDAPFSQVPEYSPIQFAGHENGDFFFLPTRAARSGP
jgi:predicted  nucleic acid-binding Zn-ribbon protein